MSSIAFIPSNPMNIIPVIGSADSTLEQRNQFQAALLRIMERQTKYDATTRSFLRAFHESRPDPVRPAYRHPLENVIRKS